MMVGRIILALLGAVAVVGGAAIGSGDGWLPFVLGIALIMAGGGTFMLAALGGTSTCDCGEGECDE